MKESIGSVWIISNIYIGLSFFPSIGKPSPGADCPPNNSFVFLFLYWLPMSFFCFCFCVFGSTFRHDFAIHLVTHPLRVGKLFGSLDTYLTPHVSVPVRRRLAVCLVWLAWCVARATTSLGALPLPSVFRQLSSWIIRGRSVVIVSALNSRRIRLFRFSVSFWVVVGALSFVFRWFICDWLGLSFLVLLVATSLESKHTDTERTDDRPKSLKTFRSSESRVSDLLSRLILPGRLVFWEKKGARALGEFCSVHTSGLIDKQRVETGGALIGNELHISPIQSTLLTVPVSLVISPFFFYFVFPTRVQFDCADVCRHRPLRFPFLCLCVTDLLLFYLISNDNCITDRLRAESPHYRLLVV